MSGPDPVRDRGGIDIGFLEMSTRPRVAVGPAMTSRRPRTNAPVQRPGTLRSYPTGAAPRAIAALSRVRDERGRRGSRPRDRIGPRGENGPVSPVARPPRARPATPSAARSALAAAASAAVAMLALPATVLAHGPTVPVPPDAASLLFGWSFDPLAWLPAMLALLLWGVGVQRANRAHPLHPIARRRTAYWVVGVFAVLYAVDSGLAAYDTTLFSMHMVQHLLLTLVGPPLLLLAGADHPAPPGLDARGAAALDPAGAPLHGRPAAVVPGRRVDRCSPASCGPATSRRCSTSPSRTRGSTASSTPCSSTRRCCSGGRSIGPDPSPWKLKPSAGRSCTSASQMPQNTFLALAIYMASAPLYAHYATTSPDLGPDAARGPAARRRDHVGRRGHRVHRDPDRADLAAGCGPRSAGASARIGGSRRSGRRSASARSASRPGARQRGRRGPARRTRSRVAAGLTSAPRAGSAPGGTRGSASGSTLPPQTTATTGPSSPRRPASAAWNRIAAIARAPDGSTTSRASSAASRTAAAISTSVTVTTSSSRTRRWAKFSRPIDCVRVPSAIVRPTSLRRPGDDAARSRSDSRASAASSGSTPMIRASGASALIADGDPAGQPAAADRDEDGGDDPAGPRRSRARPCPGRR